MTEKSESTVMFFPWSQPYIVSSRELDKGFSSKQMRVPEPSTTPTIKVSGEILSEPRHGDAGIDLRTTDIAYVYQGAIKKIYTGVHVEIPEGYVGLICPRSGMAANDGVTVVNSPGVIDSNYRGEIVVLLTKLTGGCYTAHIGDRIAQLVIVPCPVVKIQQVKELSPSNRGSDGFGSSGR